MLLWILGSLGIFPEGKTYALFFGAWYGFAELIPYVGPAIGAFPPVLLALFSDDPLDALWLSIAFTALQQIEGHIVAPTVFSQALRINPLLVIFALLLGGQLYGIIGRVHRAADRRDPARDRRLPAPPRRAGAVGPALRRAFDRRSLPNDRRRSRLPKRPERALPRMRHAAPSRRRHLPGCGTELGAPDEPASATAVRSAVA